MATGPGTPAPGTNPARPQPVTRCSGNSAAHAPPSQINSATARMAPAIQLVMGPDAGVTRGPRVLCQLVPANRTRHASHKAAEEFGWPLAPWTSSG